MSGSRFISGLLLEDLSWPELAEIAPSIEMVLIPVGSHEQHGPNLAVRMDITAAREFCRRASARMAPRLAVAPALPFGVSLHHMNFPGTITLSPDTFIQVILEVIASLQQHGFQRFMIVNGHGGNIAAMEIAAVRARTELDVDFIGACSYFSFFGDGIREEFGVSPFVGHACEIETSVAMYVSPEIVRTEALAAGELTELTTDFRPLLKKYEVTVPYYFEEYTTNGAYGDARRATPEFGRDLIESALDNFCAFTEQLFASPSFARTQK